MSDAAWDTLRTHRELARLTAVRGRFRSGRTLDRIRSPRRIAATTLAGLFFCLYLLNGVVILSARQPADPERLRLWLSGGMILYAIYHCLRCAWSQRVADLELTPAETLWLTGAPIKRSSLAIYHVSSMLVPVALKTLLLAVVLAIDVEHFELLGIGIFTSLLLLEIVRLLIVRWSAALDDSHRRWFRVAATLVAAAIVLQTIAHLIASTPLGSTTWQYILNGFRSLGQTAACDTIQYLSFPWVAAAQLAVTDQYRGITFLQLLAAATVLPLAIGMLVRVDAWSNRMKLRREQDGLARGAFRTRQMESHAARGGRGQSLDGFFATIIPVAAGDAAALISRQWVTVRRYAGTIALSFIVPTLLCLSPLVTGQVTEQWFFVVGGIALCTALLAPPALRIDFRRDLQRMLLLRSLPVPPLSMVLGQLTLPVLITCTFQWLTIAIAALVTQPGWSLVMLWTGMLNALAVFTFAAENALFLAYPHHERAEGMAMMIRAKLTFLGKTAVMLAALALLIAWSMICRQCLPQTLGMPAMIAGAITATWTIAITAILVTTWCWRRFDLSLDVPPM